MFRLKQLVSRVFRRKSLKQDAQHQFSNVVRGEGTIVQNFRLSIRKGDNYGRIKLGSDSIVSGNFVFENECGKINIGDRTFIGGGMFVCIDEINIGNDVMISWGCTIMDNNAHSLIFEERKNDVLDWKKGLEENKIGNYKDWSNVKHRKITIKDKAWIGFNCIILKGVTIGEGAVVGAGSVVLKDVPDYTVVAGNPAVIIRETK